MNERIVAAVVAATLMATSCGGASSPTGDRLLIVASTSILGDVAASIAGDLAAVETLMGPGQDPHDFRPSASQAARLRDANLVVVNGLGLEEGLAAVLEAARTDGVAVLETGPLVAPLPFGDGADAPADPHFWLDPERMAVAVDAIGAALADVDAPSAAAWTRAAEAYRQRILDVHADVEALLSSIDRSRRVLVSNHDALGYFADRYGFEVVGTIIPSGSTLAEPSAADLAALVDVIRARNVPAIFAETTHPGRLAEVVAAELGADVAVVDLYTGSLGPSGSGAATYLELLMTNARLIEEALSS